MKRTRISSLTIIATVVLASGCGDPYSSYPLLQGTIQRRTVSDSQSGVVTIFVTPVTADTSAAGRRGCGVFNFSAIPGLIVLEAPYRISSISFDALTVGRLVSVRYGPTVDSCFPTAEAMEIILDAW